MLTIEEIQPHQFIAAKAVTESVAQELWDSPLDEIRQYDPLTDSDDIQASYFGNNGTLLVPLRESVVGTDGIHAAGDQCCVLKRLWLQKPFPGQGWGKRLSLQLLEFAKTRGYRKVRLTVASPHLQEPAVGLYRKVGFIPVEEPPQTIWSD